MMIRISTVLVATLMTMGLGCANEVSAPTPSACEAAGTACAQSAVDIADPAPSLDVPAVKPAPTVLVAAPRTVNPTKPDAGAADGDADAGSDAGEQADAGHCEMVQEDDGTGGFVFTVVCN